MNLFDELDTQTEPNLFSGMEDQPDQPVADTPNDWFAARVARLAAVAQVDTTNAPDEVLNQVERMTQVHRDFIKQYGDQPLRNAAAVQQREQELRSLSAINVPGADPEIAAGVNLAAEALINEDVADRERTALEHQAVEAIRSIAESDPVQAEVMLRNMEVGGAEDHIRDMNIKQFILEREVSRMSDDVKQQGILRNVADFILGFIPLDYAMSRTGNVPVDEALNTWADSLFTPGQRQQLESASMWAAPASEFERFLTQDVMAGIKGNSTLFGYTNNTEALSLLTGLQNPSPVWMTNGMAAVDNIGLIPGAAFTKGFRLSRNMINLGARREVANAVALTTREIAENGAESALAKTGMTVDEVVENLSSTAVNIEGKINTVPVAEDAVSIIERADKAVQAITDLKSAGRLSPVEQKGAVEAIVKKMRELKGRVLKDVGVITERLTNGAQLRRVELTMGRPEGGGFASAEAAQKWASSVGWDTEILQIVPEGQPVKAVEAAQPRVVLQEMTVDDVLAAGTVDQVKGLLGDRIANAVSKGQTVEVVNKGTTKQITSVDELGDFEAIRFLEGNADEISVATPVVDESGQWFVKVRANISEAGMTTNGLQSKTKNRMASFVLNARRVGDDTLADMAQHAGDQRSKVLRAIIQPAMKVFNDLSASSKTFLGHVLTAGEKEGLWHSDNSLDMLYERHLGRPPTAKEREAYHMAIQINDIEYALRNDEIYLSRATRGYEGATFIVQGQRVDNVNALIKRNFSEAPSTRVYDLSRDMHFDKDVNPLDAGRVEAMQAEGYMLVQVEQPIKLADGTEIRNFIGKSSDIQVGLLRRDQVPYRPGGHRMYEGKYFVKQASRGVQPDTGKGFMRNPSVYINGKTKAEVQVWARTMEAARQAVKADPTIDPRVLDDIFNHSPGYPTGEEFLKGAQDGSFSLEYEFKAVYDREVLDEYLNVDPDAIHFADLDEGDFNGMLRTNGRMYYGGKGEQLRDYKGDLAQVLDPFEVINRSLKNVANLSSFSEYKLSAVDRWVEKYREFIDPNSYPNGASNAMIFNQGIFRPGGSDIRELARVQADAQKGIIKRVLGWRGEDQLLADVRARRINEWIVGDEVGTLRYKVGAQLVDWWEDTNPISAMRSLASDMKLGMFNVAQFPLQITTAAAAAMVSPEYGFKAFFAALPMQKFLTTKGSEADLNHLVKMGVGKFLDMDDVEFKDYMRYMKESGFMDVGGNHVLAYDHGVGRVTSELGNKVRQVREAGRFFFDRAEMFNRIVAFRVAWGETRKKYPRLVVNSEEFNRIMAGAREKYAWNMSEQSAAAWQKGVLSIPTQFWAYNIRMMEMMFGGELTREQRARLIIGQSVMFGAYGLPVLPFIADQIKNREGDAPDIGTWGAFADRGLFDTVLFGLTGQDILGSERLASGNFLTDTITKMFGYSQYGEVSFMDIVGGATFGIMHDTVIGPVLKHMQAESGGSIEKPFSRESVLELASNVSSVGNAIKAYWAYRYGILKTRPGSVTMEDLPPSASIYIALGLQPGHTDDLSAQMGYFKHRKQLEKEAVKVVRNYRMRMVHEVENRDFLREQIALFMQSLGPDLRQKVLKGASRDVDSSLATSLQEQYTKEMARRKSMENASGVAD